MLIFKLYLKNIYVLIVSFVRPTELGVLAHKLPIQSGRYKSIDHQSILYKSIDLKTMFFSKYLLHDETNEKQCMVMILFF